MDDDTREEVAASLIAHEMMLKFLMANLLRRMPANERHATIDAIRNMPDLEVPAGVAKDFDSADRLAGVAQKAKAQMQSIAESVFRIAPDLGGTPA